MLSGSAAAERRTSAHVELQPSSSTSHDLAQDAGGTWTGPRHDSPFLLIRPPVGPLTL